MCGPKFCSMKITQDVRDYAATLNDKGAVGDGALSGGHGADVKKFLDLGANVYVEADKVKDSNKAL